VRRPFAAALALAVLGFGLTLIFVWADLPGADPRELDPEPIPTAYTWIHEQTAPPPPPSVSLTTRFPAPSGYVRAPLAEGSFGAWLRGLPVRLDRHSVEDYRGRAVTFSGRWSAAVIALDVGEKNLQQCADTALRLHAEWLWSRGDTQALRYHFTSGDESRFSEWVAGRKLAVEGATVREVQVAPVPADRVALRAWLEQLFMYAGTRSLALDSEAVGLDAALLPGDLLLHPGSPGHVVIVLDVVEREGSGDQLALIGQGSMPAQELHVLRGDARQTVDGVWFRFPQGREQGVRVPGWGTLQRSSARRF